MKLSNLLRDYESFHRTRGNHLCHYIGIPMIAVAVLGGLAHWRFAGVDLGLLYWAAFSAVVFALDWRVGISFNLATLGLYFISRQIPLSSAIVLFVVGWILQLLGHSKYEKNRPALLTNFTHFVVGPIWVFLRSVKSK